MKILILFAILIFGQTAFARNVRKPLSVSTQAILITTENWDAVQGKLQRFERKNTNAKWQKSGEEIAIVVGKKGLGWGVGLHNSKVFQTNQPVKREGDGKSPAGIFSLTSTFGSAPNSDVSWLKMPYVSLTDAIECVDDSKSKQYNLIVDNKMVNVDWNSSEKMLAVGEQYDFGVFVAHNSPSTVGKGSCIFLHIWKDENSGTAGCSAMTKANIEEILRWLDKSKNPVLVQLPSSEYRRLRKTWQLPMLK